MGSLCFLPRVSHRLRAEFGKGTSLAALVLTARTFASLTYATDRRGYRTIAAMLAGEHCLLEVLG